MCVSVSVSVSVCVCVSVCVKKFQLSTFKEGPEEPRRFRFLGVAPKVVRDSKDDRVDVVLTTSVNRRYVPRCSQ